MSDEIHVHKEVTHSQCRQMIFIPGMDLQTT